MCTGVFEKDEEFRGKGELAFLPPATRVGYSLVSGQLLTANRIAVHRS